MFLDGPNLFLIVLRWSLRWFLSDSGCFLVGISCSGVVLCGLKVVIPGPSLGVAIRCRFRVVTAGSRVFLDGFGMVLACSV